MSIIVSKPENEGSFEQIQPGTYQAVCYGIWDIGVQITTWEGQEKQQPKIVIAWELNENMKEGDNAGKRFTISKRYTKSLGDKANLTKDLQSWRGKPFTEEELRGFDLETILGVNCQLGIIHNESNGKTYSNISSISSLMKGMPEMTAQNPSVMPEWVQKVQAKAVPVMTGSPDDIGMDEQAKAELDQVVDPFSDMPTGQVTF